MWKSRCRGTHQKGMAAHFHSLGLPLFQKQANGVSRQLILPIPHDRIAAQGHILLCSRPPELPRRSRDFIEVQYRTKWRKQSPSRFTVGYVQTRTADHKWGVAFEQPGHRLAPQLHIGHGLSFVLPSKTSRISSESIGSGSVLEQHMTKSQTQTVFYNQAVPKDSQVTIHPLRRRHRIANKPTAFQFNVPLPSCALDTS